MAIDKNTTQINNFSKGMNTDTSDAYLEDGAYRMAVNLRYTTSVGSNSGELHMIEGCTDLIEGNGQVVKKATQLRNVGILVTEDNSSWYVYTIEGNDRVLRAHINNKDRVWHKNISIVCRYEDNNNQKLYIADGAGPIIVIPLANNDENNNPIVARELNPMLAYPSALLDIPKFSGLITGNLKSGVYQYAYQLYKKHAGQSEMSVPTKMIHLHKGNPSYTNATQSEGYEKDVYTDKGIRISVFIDQELRNTFDRIYIYRIHYKEVGQVPDIDLVYDDNIPKNGNLIFSDTGIKSISVISLEEYNSITGIHIIPSVIEAKDDFLFAANIDNDSPIYKDDAIRTWKASDYPDLNVEIEEAEITGDVGDDDSCIKIKDNQTGGVEALLQAKGQRDFVGEINDDNKTYANAYIQYTLKSLRRGEVYRYGIIFYDKDGNASAVKHLKDVTVDDWIERPTFEKRGDKLIVKPIGVKFKNLHIPSSVKKYEIVRCGRDYSDIQTLTQCVLSRPIQRSFEQLFSDGEDYSRPQSKYPLTPTGLVTTQDYTSSMIWYTTQPGHALPIKDLQGHIPNDVGDAWDGPYTLLATNTDLLDLNRRWDISGNKNVLQIISPEYNYQPESMKEMLYNTELEITPLAYIYPFQKRILTATWVAPPGSGGSGSGVAETAEYQYFDIGNEYSHFPVINNTIAIDNRGGTILSYYIPRNYLHGNISLDNDAFNTEFREKSAGRYSYIKMYDHTNLPSWCYDNNGKIKTYKIESTGFPDTLSWDDFASSKEEYQLKYIDKVCAVGSTNFVNWVSNGVYNMDWQNESTPEGPYRHFKLDQEHLNDTSSIVGSMMGPGGKCFVAKLNSNDFANNRGIVENHYFGTYLCNIRKKSTPYGGDSDSAKENSTYRSFGNLFDSSVTNPIVFDGDCYILPFEYVSQHKWYHPYLPSCRNACVIYSVPMETNINIPYSCGYEFSRHIGDDTISNIQDQPANVNNIFIQGKPLYAYDTVNNTVPTAKTLIPETDEEDAYNTNMDYRVYHSEKKSNNERTDSWLMYKPADYLDVDNRYGAITGLRKFNNALVFWQEAAAGILQVNERAQITDDNNLPLILGTGGVLGRYDYINTKNGMREGEFADTQSDNMLYWWDHDKKQILSYTSGVMAQELSKIKFVQSFFSNCDDVDDPVLFFDKQNNEAVFKVSNEGSVVFNENTGQFTGLYTISPSGAIILPSSLLLVSNDAAVKTWNSLNDNGVIGLDGTELLPKLKYVVNSNALMTKTFDNTEFGGRVYGGGDQRTYVDSNPLKHISFDFYTPMKQHGNIKGDKIDNTEYNFRFAIPRAKVKDEFGKEDDAICGGRLRGKTMEVVMQSDTNNYDFSLQFILTKYRISWA